MTPQRRSSLLGAWANVRKSAEELNSRLASVWPEADDFLACEAIREAEKVALGDMQARARAIAKVADLHISTLMENGGKF